jgi:hypothetical protein
MQCSVSGRSLDLARLYQSRAVISGWRSAVQSPPRRSGQEVAGILGGSSGTQDVT